MSYLGEINENELFAAIDAEREPVAVVETVAPDVVSEPVAVVETVAPDVVSDVSEPTEATEVEQVYMEALIIKGIFENEHYRKCVFDFITPGLFIDKPVAAIFKHSQDTWITYGTLSDKETIVNDSVIELRDDIKNRLDVVEQMPFNTLENQTELVLKTNQWLIKRKTEDCILALVDATESNNTKAITELSEQLAEFQSLMISGSDDNPLNIFTGTEFRAMPIPERRYFLYPILPKDDYNLTYSPDGVGKSIFWFAVCDAITKGEDMGPWRNTIGEPVDILYIDGEMSNNDSQDRLEQMQANDHFHFIHCGTNWETNIKINQDLNDIHFQKQILKEVLDRNIKLVVFDNLTSLVSGNDENAKLDYDATNRFFLLLKHHHVAPIVLHHANKAGDQSGTTSHRRNVDSVFSLALPKNYRKEHGAKFKLTIQKLRSAKVNVENKHLVKTRELRYAQNLSDHQWEWTFDEVNLNSDPAFFMDVVSNEFTQIKLSEKYDTGQGTVSKAIRNLVERDMIIKNEDGIYVPGTAGQEQYGVDLLMAEFQ